MDELRAAEQRMEALADRAADELARWLAFWRDLEDMLTRDMRTEP